MLVKARHGVKYDGVWYKAGAEFEISLTDADRMTDMVTPVEEPLHAEPIAEEPQRTENVKPTSGRGRKKLN